nr:hypothetical protein [Tanacetum cinerariifolium]
MFRVDRIEDMGTIQGEQVHLGMGELRTELGMQIQVKQGRLSAKTITADECDAFDSDVDEASTVHTMFMANLSFVDPVYDEAGPSYNSDILSEVHGYENYQDAVCELHEFVKDNAESVVQNTVSSVPHDASMMIINEMHEQTVKCVSVKAHTKVVDALLTVKLTIYKEQVELYERQAKFELIKREQNIEEQLRIVITERNIKEANLKKELHPVKMQLNSTINHNKSMVEEVTKHDKIEWKNLLIANDNLISNCLSKEVFFIATNSELTVSRFIKMHDAHTVVRARCLELKAELSKLTDKIQKDDHNELVKRFSNLELKYQNLKDSLGNNPPTPDKDTLDFDSVFVIDKMQASLQEKDNVIRQLKKQISHLQGTRSDTDRTLKVTAVDSQITRLTKTVTVLHAQNDSFRAENDKIKQHYKELNNREAHLDYLRHLKESVETIHDIVKEAKVVVQIVLWYLDSGRSKQMTGDRSRLMNFVKKFIGTVRFGNDDFGAIMGYGDYVIGDSVISRKHYCYVRDTDGVELIKGSRGSNLYTISVEDMIKTPQQNDFVERRNRTLIEAAQMMLILSKASMFLWAEAVATACYTKNRSLIHTRHNKTPYEMMHNKKPDLTFFRVFGAICYPINNNEDLGKLQPTANIRIFVGYAPSRKGYRIYNKRTRRITKTIHVQFDELTEPMALVHLSTGPALMFLMPGQISLGIVPTPVPAAPYTDFSCSSSKINSAGTPSSTTNDQDAPSPSISPSSSTLQSHQGVAVESTFMEDNPVAPVDNNPFC